MKGLIYLKVPVGFGASRRKAESYARDIKKSAQLIQKAYAKANQQEHRVKHVWRDLELLIKMVKAWASGEYKEIPLKNIVTVLAALIYFVNPLDIMPDAILGLGYLDDITVISYVLNIVRKDVEKFAEWSKAADDQEQLIESSVIKAEKGTVNPGTSKLH